MSDAGAKVFLTAGVTSSQGIQHSKTVLVDDHLLLGSTNWTNSSRTNTEGDVVVKLNERGQDGWAERLKACRQYAVALTPELISSAQEVRRDRTRAKSADQYKTAKRFSIARARKQEQIETAARLGVHGANPQPEGLYSQDSVYLELAGDYAG